jgi:hypothetical protein
MTEEARLFISGLQLRFNSHHFFFSSIMGKKINSFMYLNSFKKCHINEYLPIGIITIIEGHLNLIRLSNFPFMLPLSGTLFRKKHSSYLQLHALQKRQPIFPGFFLK